MKKSNYPFIGLTENIGKSKITFIKIFLNFDCLSLVNNE